jgi:hypothetical protein
MRTLITLLALACAGACAGSSPSASHVDAGRTCDGALYDPCADEHNCPMTGICQSFNDVGFEACSKTCTVGDDTTCPVTNDGRSATCTMVGSMAVCKPPAPNNCLIAQ